MNEIQKYGKKKKNYSYFYYTGMPRLPGIRLGAAYNIFDGEELLQSSIKSIRREVDYIAIVYQKTSNFGCKASDKLLPILQELSESGLVDKVIEYKTKTFSIEERFNLLSEYSNVNIGNDGLQSIGEQFFNELMKRNIGHQLCLSAGCSHLISIDADEFYVSSQIKFAKDFLIRNPQYDASACLMYQYFKTSKYQLKPVDNSAYVPFIYKITGNLPEIESGAMFKLAHPFPVSVDPTRVLAGTSKLKIFSENEVVMHHMSFVRTVDGMLSKMMNVSNRSNYNKSPDDITKEILNWKIDGNPSFGLIASRIPHPHPALASKFTHVQIVDNIFSVPEALHN